MTAGVRVTPSMVRGLEVLALGPARYSNLTARGATDPDGAELGRCIYWQAADRLELAGLARIAHLGAGETLVLATPAGLEHLEALK